MVSNLIEQVEEIIEDVMVYGQGTLDIKIATAHILNLCADGAKKAQEEDLGALSLTRKQMLGLLDEIKELRGETV